MALRVNESEFYSNSVSGSTNSVSGNQGQAAAAGVSASVDEAKIHDMFEDLLRSYEKAKVKLGELSLTASAGLISGPNNLATILAGNPLWEALNTPNGQAKPPVSPSDTKNLFSLIFKYMEENSDIAAKVQVAQAVNILAKQEVIDVSSKEGIDSMNATEVQLAHIQSEQSSADSFWGRFLKIAIPIIMGFILLATIVATVLTGGATAGAVVGEVAADAAIDGSLEAGGEAIEMVSMASVAPDAAAPAIAGETTADAAINGSVEAGGEAIEMTDMADVAPDAAETTTETTEQTSSVWQSIKNVLLSKPVLIGAAAEGITGAFAAAIPGEIEPLYANKAAGQASDAGAEEQASAVIQSGAVTNLESQIQEDMSIEQFEQSIQQSSLSLAEQTATLMTKVYSLG